MLIGIVGAPNKGKSTIFSAMTLNEVAMADYPFTTIKPNMGIGYATRPCVEKELGVRCEKNPQCSNGIRKIPVNVIDVAGLVEGASEGKGMGNQFLSDMAAADVLLVVADASGKTDGSGNQCDSCDPTDDVKMVRSEMAKWVASIVMRHIPQMSKKASGLDSLADALAGIKASRDEIKFAMEVSSMPSDVASWSQQDCERFANALMESIKPMIVVANKCDAKGAEGGFSMLRSAFGDGNVIGISAAVELALAKAERQGMISGTGQDFRIIGNASAEQSGALEYMRNFIKSNGRLSDVLDRAVFGIQDNILVYPVEDENRMTDRMGNVLPDAVLMRNGSTALDLAAKVHTDIAKGMLYAIDARSKMRLSKDYVLKDNDVIRIVSAARS